MSPLEPEPPTEDAIAEPPPILGSWRNLYWLLIIELAVLTIAGYVLTWWAA
jgi:hypothetical protein